MAGVPTNLLRTCMIPLECKAGGGGRDERSEVKMGSCLMMMAGDL